MMIERRRTLNGLVVSVLLLFAAGTVAANDVAAMWTRVYRRASALEDRFAVMRTIVAQGNPQLSALLVDTLVELNSEREQLGSTTERLVHTEFTKLVVRGIGELRAPGAAPQLFDLVRNATDAYLRGEAILALGKLGAADYADDIAVLLRNLNLNYDTGGGTRSAEVVAYACVLALERFRQPVGFRPLFFASIGWYSPASRVRQTAREVMHSIIDDPTDFLKDIVRLDGEYAVKLEALIAQDGSSAPPERKTEVAVEGLRQGLIRQPATVVDSNLLSRIRLKSMEMMAEYQSQSEVVTNLLEELLYRNYDVNEKLTAVAALGSQGSDEAVLALVRFLKLQNERQSRGVVPDDYRVIRATIQTLGRLRNELAVEELTMVRVSNWTNAVVREANTALEQILGE